MKLAASDGKKYLTMLPTRKHPCALFNLCQALRSSQLNYGLQKLGGKQNNGKKTISENEN